MEERRVGEGVSLNFSLNHPAKLMEPIFMKQDHSRVSFIGLKLVQYHIEFLRV